MCAFLINDQFFELTRVVIVSSTVRIIKVNMMHLSSSLTAIANAVNTVCMSQFQIYKNVYLLGNDKV